MIVTIAGLEVLVGFLENVGDDGAALSNVDTEVYTAECVTVVFVVEVSEFDAGTVVISRTVVVTILVTIGTIVVNLTV